MKRLLIVLFIVLFAIPAFAGLSGKSFTVEVGGQNYELYFSQAPVSGGVEAGYVILLCGGDESIRWCYQWYGDCGKLDRFLFTVKDGKLEIYDKVLEMQEVPE